MRTSACWGNAVLVLAEQIPDAKQRWRGMKIGDLHIPPVYPSSSVRDRRIYEGAMAVMKKSRDIRIAAMIQEIERAHV